MMLDNLENALNTAFGEDVQTRRTPHQKMAIRTGNIELIINGLGELCMVSGVGTRCFDVNVDRHCRTVSATGTTVESMA